MPVLPKVASRMVRFAFSFPVASPSRIIRAGVRLPASDISTAPQPSPPAPRHVPYLPDFPRLPYLPDFPGLPHLPDLPGLPDLPDLPGLLDLPDFPGLPDLPEQRMSAASSAQ